MDSISKTLSSTTPSSHSPQVAQSTSAGFQTTSESKKLSRSCSKTLSCELDPDTNMQYVIAKLTVNDSETTSMRTHCPHTDNFVFIDLTTVAEANRAVKELNHKRLLNQKVAVYHQRPKEDSDPQLTSRESRSRIIGMGPSKRNATPQPPVGMMPPPLGAYASLQPHAPSFNPYGGHVPFIVNPPLYNNQCHPTPSFNPPLPIVHAYSQPMHTFPSSMLNYNFASPAMPGFVAGGHLSSVHQPSTNPYARCHRRRRQQPPPSYDGASDTPFTSNQSSSMNTSIADQGPLESGPRAQLPLVTISEPSGSPCSTDQNSPALVSSGPNPEVREWTSFREDELEDAYQSLNKHCHGTDVLIAAGINVVKPTTPPAAVLKAKVKCRSCRISKEQLERKVAGLGSAGCTISRNGKHAFPGIKHLTARYEGFKHAPSHCRTTIKRRAIALDCEMAGARNRDGLVDQLIQLTAIDYLTGEVLISTLVKPTLDIQQWRSNIHGVTHAMMAQAVQDGTALESASHAREVLFSLMDVNTILIGHALKNDLNVLKIVHSRCVDSEVLAISAINRPGHNGIGLKKLCDTLMGLAVQTGKTHSCLEDSFAAREAVVFMISHPDVLAQWAKAKQKVLDEDEAKRVIARQAREIEPEKTAAKLVKKEAHTDTHKKEKEENKDVLVAHNPKVDTAAAPSVLHMAMPALIPTPTDEIEDELQMKRGPAAGKKRKGGKWKVISAEEE